MATGGNPFAAVDKDCVIGTLRATGSRDPDVLRDRKRSLIRSLRIPQLVGAALLFLGGLVSVTAAGLLVGVPIAGLGWWLWRRGARNVAAVEAGYTEFVKTPTA